MAGGICGLGQQPEVLDRQPGVLVRSDEQAVGARPITAGGRPPAAFQQLRLGHVAYGPICRHTCPPACGNTAGYPGNSLPHAYRLTTLALGEWRIEDKETR